MTATLVVLSFMALAIPSMFDVPLVEANAQATELFFSEGIALILIVLYALYLIHTMRDGAGSTGHGEAHHEPKWTMSRALGLLAAATVGIVVMSEFLVGAVEPVTQQLGWTEFFVGIIIVPIVGNVAEHLVAVQTAIKDKMDLSINIAVGSGLQIALFVAPVLVFISLLFEGTLLLVFNVYELIALFAAAFVTALVSLDGETNWFEGAMLLAVYFILALAFFVLPGTTQVVH
jgi:Ca2+:H+ antiporter